MFSKAIAAALAILATGSVVTASPSLVARQSDCIPCVSSAVVTLPLVGDVTIPLPSTCVAPGATCVGPFTTVSGGVTGVAGLGVTLGVRSLVVSSMNHC